MTGALLNKYESHIQELTLIPSDGGRFEVSMDDELIYSKLKTGRHAEVNEILTAVGARISQEKA
ncbi:MAG: SelT/SelW/SelH family protein [Anaerolineae bacterium]|nr:MAG: SelT/SelW/SelH family protein [Anaerolineae bacterium]